MNHIMSLNCGFVGFLVDTRPQIGSLSPCVMAARTKIWLFFLVHVKTVEIKVPFLLLVQVA